MKYNLREESEPLLPYGTAKHLKKGLKMGKKRERNTASSNFLIFLKELLTNKASLHRY